LLFDRLRGIDLQREHYDAEWISTPLLGVIGVVRGEGGAEIWAGFKISKEMELF
jgi:hypothetical protein